MCSYLQLNQSGCINTVFCTEQSGKQSLTEKAVHLCRHQLLKAAEREEVLTMKLNMGKSPEDRERDILQFYKAPNVNWARGLIVVLIGKL